MSFDMFVYSKDKAQSAHMSCKIDKQRVQLHKYCRRRLRTSCVHGRHISARD